jgi:hypothetical protein
VRERGAGGVGADRLESIGGERIQNNDAWMEVCME